MTLSLGTVIYTAVKPIVKIYFIIAIGYWLAKRNVLSVLTSRDLSDMILSVTTPCLIFNKIVGNIQNSDIKIIGILVLTSVMIYFLGAGCAYLTRWLTPVPLRWAHGIVFAGVLPNISDLPIAYMQSMGTGSVFTEAEANRGVSFVIIFLATYIFLMFNLGLYKLVQMDFREPSQDAESARCASPLPPVDAVSLTSLSSEEDKTYHPQSFSEAPQTAYRRASISQSRRVSASRARRPSMVSIDSQHSNLRRMPSETIHDVIREYSRMDSQEELSVFMDIPAKALRQRLSEQPWVRKYHLGFLVAFVQNFFLPSSLALVVSITIAMIPWAKALFVTTNISLPNAPDAMPALSFFMDFTSYVGAAAVPLGLIMLGGTIARLSLDKKPPGFWKSALLLTILKLAVMPIFGVLWANRLQKLGWLEGEKVALFIIVINWALPSATGQVYLTATYTLPDSPDHVQMDCLAIYLLMQYPILTVSLPLVVTYGIKNVLHY
ncbi:hypothetical protein BABINDRAFT_38371 [Babjeviella inositovora NRRL Y-12698]|uniref:Auxin efflux carrier n=1 Tax=Babjeviella inositovora NRRL Y-12698 TaxID=984486 RepID=A0A1E3QMK6_9ASCO|nr:uncharacterized protein BABINDRAFT_38371 [Babjeviella inositovora NRRL Y-12698]ODQ78946.1 hypothetical protein BABINDRAFT_38371 [Babjeviella inositovora NRRL Y-12698]